MKCKYDEWCDESYNNFPYPCKFLYGKCDIGYYAKAEEEMIKIYTKEEIKQFVNECELARELTK